MSANVMEQLLECKLCRKRLRSPRMLTCQHTFCLSCLQAIVQPTNEALECPSCSQQVNLRTPGPEGILELPTNLCLEPLLKSLEEKPTSGQGGQGCSKCKTVGSTSVCQHCLQALCTVCWSKHITELESQLPGLWEQLHGAKEKLRHHLQDFTVTCKRMQQQITTAVEYKIQTLRVEEESLKLKTGELLKEGELSFEALLQRITDAQHTISKDSFDAIPENKKKVALFLQLHRTTSTILEDVSKWGEAPPIFNEGHFRIETPTERKPRPRRNSTIPVDPLSGILESSTALINSPDDLCHHYKTRSSTPCGSLNRSVSQHPAGVGVAPWEDEVHMYVAGTDGREVLVIDRTKMKLVHKLTTQNMLYPCGIAFSKHLREVYVTDKWKHCVHVFSAEGTYLRQLGKMGYAEGQFQSPQGITSGPRPDGSDDKTFLYVCDTGNYRVQIIDPHNGSTIRILGIMTQQAGQKYKCTDFDQPTGIAVSKDRVIVSDSGDNKIKIYNLAGQKLEEFGSKGEEKGQFRSPECVAVDHLGFILVGDSGNARVQIFQPNGTLVRVFGGRGTNPGKFASVSGITIANNMDIIVTDAKNSSVHIFK